MVVGRHLVVLFFLFFFISLSFLVFSGRLLRRGRLLSPGFCIRRSGYLFRLSQTGDGLLDDGTRDHLLTVGDALQQKFREAVLQVVHDFVATLLTFEGMTQIV